MCDHHTPLSTKYIFIIGWLVRGLSQATHHLYRLCIVSNRILAIAANVRKDLSRDTIRAFLTANTRVQIRGSVFDVHWCLEKSRDPNQCNGKSIDWVIKGYVTDVWFVTHIMDQLCRMSVQLSAVVQRRVSTGRRVFIAFSTHVPLSGFRLIYFYSVAWSFTDSNSVETRSV